MRCDITAAMVAQMSDPVCTDSASDSTHGPAASVSVAKLRRTKQKAARELCSANDRAAVTTHFDPRVEIAAAHYEATHGGLDASTAAGLRDSLSERGPVGTALANEVDKLRKHGN